MNGVWGLTEQFENCQLFCVTGLKGREERNEFKGDFEEWRDEMEKEKRVQRWDLGRIMDIEGRLHGGKFPKGWIRDAGMKYGQNKCVCVCKGKIMNGGKEKVTFIININIRWLIYVSLSL